MSVVDEEKPSGYNTCGLMKVLNLNTELLELPIIYLLFSPRNFFFERLQSITIKRHTNI